MLKDTLIGQYKANYGEKGYLHTFITKAIEDKRPMSEIVRALKAIKNALATRLPNGNIP